MKKFIKNSASIILAFFIFSNVSNAQSNSDQKYIGKARAAVQDCISKCLQQGIDVQGNVEITGICFFNGMLRRVNFYTSIKCHQEPCPKIASRLVATVDFDCDGNVISSACY